MNSPIYIFKERLCRFWIPVAAVLIVAFVLSTRSLAAEETEERGAEESSANIAENSANEGGESDASGDEKEPDPFAGVEVPDYERLAEFPFKDGEKIYFNLRWSFFDVGEATLEFQGPTEWEGIKCWKIILEARTNGFADKIFKVRDYNAVWVDETFSRPIYYIKNQKEGSTDREVVVTFDWENNKAQYTNRDYVRDPIDVLPDSWDPLGITYRVRHLLLSGLDHVSIPSTDGKKCTMTEIDLSYEEDVDTPAGEFDTILLRPDTKDLGGVFKKSKNAGIKIWFTDDERHIPVKMASKVVVGSFVAEMVRLEGPGAEKYNQNNEDEKRKGSSSGRRKGKK